MKKKGETPNAHRKRIVRFESAPTPKYEREGERTPDLRCRPGELLLFGPRTLNIKGGAQAENRRRVRWEPTPGAKTRKRRAREALLQEGGKAKKAS